MQRVGLLERLENISLLGEKAVLRRNVLTVEGPGKGNGIPCSSVGEKEQVEVRILKDFNLDGGVQYIEYAVGDSRRGVKLHLGIRERC
jgi:hypothetical protein